MSSITQRDNIALAQTAQNTVSAAQTQAKKAAQAAKGEALIRRIVSTIIETPESLAGASNSQITSLIERHSEFKFRLFSALKDASGAIKRSIRNVSPDKLLKNLSKLSKMDSTMFSFKGIFLDAINSGAISKSDAVKMAVDKGFVSSAIANKLGSMLVAFVGKRGFDSLNRTSEVEAFYKENSKGAASDGAKGFLMTLQNRDKTNLPTANELVKDFVKDTGVKKKEQPKTQEQPKENDKAKKRSEDSKRTEQKQKQQQSAKLQKERAQNQKATAPNRKAGTDKSPQHSAAVSAQVAAQEDSRKKTTANPLKNGATASAQKKKFGQLTSGGRKQQQGGKTDKAKGGQAKQASQKQSQQENCNLSTVNVSSGMLLEGVDIVKLDPKLENFYENAKSDFTFAKFRDWVTLKMRDKMSAA